MQLHNSQSFVWSFYVFTLAYTNMKVECYNNNNNLVNKNMNITSGHEGIQFFTVKDLMAVNKAIKSLLFQKHNHKR